LVFLFAWTPGNQAFFTCLYLTQIRLGELYNHSCFCLCSRKINFLSFDYFERGQRLQKKVFHMKKCFVLLIAISSALGYSYAQQLFGASKSGMLYGFIDLEGNWVIPEKFNKVDIFRDGVARVELNQKWGYINEKGQWLIGPQFDKAKNFVNGLAQVKSGDKYGLINKKGEWVIKAEFDNIEVFQNGIVRARKDKWGFLNEKSEWVIKPVFESLYDFSDGVAHGWFIIDKEGKQIGSNFFVGLRNLEDGVFRARNDKWGIVGKDGEWICKQQFSNLEKFRNERARAKMGEFWGFVTTKGQWIVQPTLQAADDFSEGLARAKLNGKWGFIDTDGKWVIEAQYKDAENFVEGYAVVKTKDGWGIISKTGEFAVKPAFKKLRTREEDKLFTAMF
jgi:hypothetical protein